MHKVSEYLEGHMIPNQEKKISSTRFLLDAWYSFVCWHANKENREEGPPEGRPFPFPDLRCCFIPGLYHPCMVHLTPALKVTLPPPPPFFYNHGILISYLLRLSSLQRPQPWILKFLPLQPPPSIPP